MGWLANKIVELLIVHEAVAEDDRDLYEYAAVCFLMTMAPLLMAVFVGGIMGELGTGVSIIFPFMALRKFSGGYHAKHMETCLFCSSGLLVICILVSTQIIYSWQLCGGMFLGAIALFHFSPIDSENRRLNDEEKKRYKYMAGIISLVVCIISVLVQLCGGERFAVCMAIGLLLTFTLQIPCILQKVIRKLSS